MDFEIMCRAVDHTFLAPDAVWRQISGVLDDAVRYGVASACIPPSHVRRAREYVGGALSLSTVAGFPNGYAAAEAKVFEAAQAIADGADEIDLIAHIGLLKDRQSERLCAEIQAVKAVCGERILKVAAETALLAYEEKIALCAAVNISGADYIKISTGYFVSGTSSHDILLCAGHLAPGVHIAACGNIASLEDARRFLNLGARRLCTDRVIDIIKSGREL